MTILYYVIAFIACLASGAAGAWGMRLYDERKRIIAEREDPRDTQIRDLQASMKIAKEDVVKARTKELEANEHLDIAHKRIEELLERSASANEKFVTCEQTLKQEIAEKELIESKLKATDQQLESVKQRAQEMEMELSVNRSGDMLDPEHQGGVPHQENDAPEEDALTSTVVDDGPSLIQCLTKEMERWKRHCRVLGDELKAQRDRLVSEQSPPPANGPNHVFDDLTDIKGIGKVLARKLHELGIYTFDQLASLNEADLDGESTLDDDFFRRMHRDDWVGQARAIQQSTHNQHP